MSAEKFEKYMREDKNVVRIAGSASFERDIEADFVIVSGALKSTGTIKAKVLKVAGSASLKKINADEVSIAGSAKVQEDLTCSSVRVAGSMRAEVVKCREVNAAGSISANSIEAEKVVIKFSDGTVKSIRAEIVKIYPERRLILPFRRKFTAKEIKGKDVSLVGVSCDEVDADNAFIGDYCEIGVLRCRNAEISRKAKVREVVRGDSGKGTGKDL
ncbi:MAG: hypothetical protein ACP5JF_03085 [Candidatus Methanodesulfokora sp.]|jgi:cytoskeletal protein CcmA (bactofilin family)|nr:MAG: hypothetical protein C0200_06045 [Candidatus Korarchaeota archaeon]